MSEEKKEENPKEYNLDNNNTRAYIIGGVLCVWGLSWLGNIFLIEKYTERGQFGDMFGAVNSLFSGLAFAGIIYTIILQRIELRAQREELQLTREELAGQKKEFRTQNVTLKRQRFESTFFNMLSIHFKISEQIKYKSETGIRAFGQAVMLQRTVEQESKIFSRDECIKRGNEFAKGYYPYFSPYILSVLQLHNIIKEGKFKSKAEKRYLNILNSYLSHNEKLFISFHYLLDSTNEHERYLLKKLNEDIQLIDIQIRDGNIDPYFRNFILSQ